MSNITKLLVSQSEVNGKIVDAISAMNALVNRLKVRIAHLEKEVLSLKGRVDG